MNGYMDLETYISRHIDPEDEYLYRLYRATNIHLVRPHMVSGHVEGVLLRMLVRMLHPRNILEIGTFTGYSAIAMSYGLDGDGHIYTYDVNDELEDFARGWIENSRRGHMITYTIGNVLEVLPPVADGTGLRFDLAFIDGDKREYPAYYRMLMGDDGGRRLVHGGSIPNTTGCASVTSAPAAISWPTTRSGTATSSTMPTTATHKRSAYAPSTTSWPPTRNAKR